LALKVSSGSGQVGPVPVQREGAGTAGRELCFACMRYHAPPRCDHDADAPCLFCLKPRGYRWTGDDGGEGGRRNQCWACWWKQETQ
jgi:hypothetical protein